MFQTWTSLFRYLNAKLTLSLLAVTLPSADNLCKQFEPRSGQMFQTVWHSDSVLDRIFWKRSFWKIKKKWTFSKDSKSADDNKRNINYPVCKESKFSRANDISVAKHTHLVLPRLAPEKTGYLATCFIFQYNAISLHKPLESQFLFFINYGPSWHLCLSLNLCLLVSSAQNPFKQFVPRSTLFDTDSVLEIIFRKENDLEKISRRQKSLKPMQTVWT